MPSSGDLGKEIVFKLLQVYTKRSNNVIFTSLFAYPKFIAADFNPFHSVSLSTALLLRTVEMDTSALLDLELPIAHRKSKRSCT